MSRFYFVANNLALDLANTLAVNDDGHEVDLIASFDDLIDWALEAKIVDRRQAADARRVSDEATRSEVLNKAVRLRSSLKSLASALGAGKLVPKTAIEQINSVLSEKSGHFKIVRTSGGYRSDLDFGYEDVHDLMLPVAESAMDLLCYGDLAMVKQCAREGCVLYFFDTSKRHGRKWCSMTACGNRAKAAAFYERSRVGDR